MSLGFNHRNWTIGLSWGEYWICICILCVGLTFDRPAFLGGVSDWS
jgi:hypothetical protein